MAITYHKDLIQGSDEWHAARCGLLTASEMNLIITPTLKIASNDKERSHLYELLAQRINNYVEPRYIGEAMLRGDMDELEARKLYDMHYEPVTEVGFITNNKWGFTLGYSPDGLVGEKGAIECKSRCQKYQLQTLLENAELQTAPADFVMQLQTGMLVAELEWIDFISYCGGMPMLAIRVFPDTTIQQAIVAAAYAFEQRLAEKLALYQTVMNSSARLIPTERRVIEDMHL